MPKTSLNLDGWAIVQKYRPIVDKQKHRRCVFSSGSSYDA